MNANQIASLVDVGIPLLAACLLLAKPSLFTKKNLNAPENAAVKNRLSLAGKLALLAAALLFAAKAGDIFRDQKTSTDALLAQIVDQMNRKSPKTVDEFTSLERVSALNDTLVYHYLLQGLDTSELSESAFAEALKPALIAQIPKGPFAEDFRARKIHLRHHYETRDRPYNVTINIAPHEY